MENTTQRPRTTPKDFFLHVGAVAALYFLVVNLVRLLFATIDAAFPRTPESAGFIPDVSFPIAALIIGFPVYLLLMRLALRGEAENPARRELPVRRWLSYLTLFIAGAAIVIDLVFLLTAFLRGEEITAGFLLKVLAVLAVAATVFGYYLSDLRQLGRNTERYFAVGGALLIVLSIGFGFSVFGSPATQRVMRFDVERVSDLQTIQWQVLSYWQRKGALPSTLDELKDPLSGFDIPVDPASATSYEYRSKGPLSFELCASFARPSLPVSRLERSVAKPVPFGGEAGFLNEDWQHNEGRTCFERTIDPERHGLSPAEKRPF